MKRLLTRMKLDHIARYLKYRWKSYNPNHNHYDYTMSFDEVMRSNDFTEAQKLELINNPAPFIKKQIEGKEVVIGVKYWRDNEYKLRKIKTYWGFRPLSVVEDSLIYVKNDKLYRSTHGQCEFLSDFHLEDRQYSEMVSKDGYYAIRSGSYISVSRDLHNWKVIYQGKRGIKNSMLITDKNDSRVLIFIEYSTGICFDEHRILQYDYKSDTVSILKSFPNSRNDRESPDSIRHIHVIQEDPYSGYLYVGTGDDDKESKIYESQDKGNTWSIISKGSQLSRTLSFMFTENSILWNTDTFENQFIVSLSKGGG